MIQSTQPAGNPRMEPTSIIKGRGGAKNGLHIKGMRADGAQMVVFDVRHWLAVHYAAARAQLFTATV